MAEIQEYKHFERPTTSKPEVSGVARRSFFLLLTALIGLLTGAAGFTVMSVYYSSTLPPTDNFQNWRPAVFPSSIDQPLTARVHDIRRFNSAVYFDRSTVAQDVYQQLPSPADYIGPALSLTSDGWMVAGGNYVTGGKYRLLVDGRFYPATETIHDNFTKVTFLKINKNFLNPVDISNSIPGEGEQLFFEQNTGFGRYLFGLAHVSDSRYYPVATKEDYSRSSDEPGDYFAITSGSAPVSGRAYFNLGGQFVGLAEPPIGGSDTVLLPARYIKSAFESTLRKQKLPDLGIHYLDFSQFDRTSDRYGIVIYHPTVSAVKSKSLAEKAGLKRLDVITAINNEVISAQSSFDYLWYKHAAEGNVTLKVERNSQELNISIPLGA